MPFEAEQHAVPLERLCCFLGICTAEPALPGFEQSSDFRMQLTITLNGVTIGVSEGTSRQLLTDVLQVIRNA